MIRRGTVYQLVAFALITLVGVSFVMARYVGLGDRWAGGSYLVSVDLISQFYEVREELFPELYPSGKYPPNTLLVIDRLVKPEFLLEIEAIAYVPASGASGPA